VAQCTATSKRSGNRCERQAGRVPVCIMHGGKAPQVRDAAARRDVEAKARAAIRGMVIEPVANPLTALSEVVGEILTFKTYMAGQVDELKHLTITDEKGAEQVRATLAAYERGLDRSALWLTAIAKLNIDERLARVSESQVMMVVRAFEAGLASIGVAGYQAQTAKQAMAVQLRLVS
jgi:hypothetical protein